MEARIYKKKIGDIFLENDLCNTALEVVRKFPPFRFGKFFLLGQQKKKIFLFPIFFFPGTTQPTFPINKQEQSKNI